MIVAIIDAVCRRNAIVAAECHAGLLKKYSIAGGMVMVAPTKITSKLREKSLVHERFHHQPYVNCQLDALQMTSRITFQENVTHTLDYLILLFLTPF